MNVNNNSINYPALTAAGLGLVCLADTLTGSTLAKGVAALGDRILTALTPQSKENPETIQRIQDLFIEIQKLDTDSEELEMLREVLRLDSDLTSFSTDALELIENISRIMLSRLQKDESAKPALIEEIKEVISEILKKTPDAKNTVIQITNRPIRLDNVRYQLDYLSLNDLKKLKEKLKELEESLATTPSKVDTTLSEKVAIGAIETENLKKRALALNGELSKVVIGQPQAVDAVCDAICCRMAGLSDPNQPIGRFLFVGPTGVGKTEMAKAIASKFFTTSSILSINIPEYTNEGGIWRLIGSAAGYKGHEEGGLLTNFVMKNPNSVILIDEVEKGTPTILDLFLKILDEGSIQDSKGNTVDFKNTVIIFTSNAGASTNNIPEAVKQTFRPEFLARLNKVVTFAPISKEMNAKIVDLELEKIAIRAKEKGMHLNFSSDLKTFLYEKTFANSSGKGAREIRNIISDFIIVPLSLKIISSNEPRDFSLDSIAGNLEIQEELRVSTNQLWAAG